MFIAEPGRQTRTRSGGLERWGGTEDRPTALDMSNSHERFGGGAVQAARRS